MLGGGVRFACALRSLPLCMSQIKVPKYTTAIGSLDNKVTGVEYLLLLCPAGRESMAGYQDLRVASEMCSAEPLYRKGILFKLSLSRVWGVQWAWQCAHS